MGYSANLELIYAQPGSAEALRHSLKIGQISFKDSKISSDEFAALDSRGPVLVIDGVHYKHSLAVIRFVGSVNGYWGFPKDPFAAAEVDELLCELAELRKKIAVAGKFDPDACIERRNEIADCELATLLEKFDVLVEGTGKGVCLDSGTSILDTEVASLVAWLNKGTITGIPTNTLENFNSLLRLQYELMRHKAIGRSNAKARDL